MPGDVTITASVDGKPDVLTTKTITLKSQPVDNVFTATFATTPSEINANGTSTLKGTIALVKSKSTSFTLKTSAPGSVFLPDNKDEITVELDDSGKRDLN
ncbi:MAG: hypothetical protein WDO15_21750 [Bacteroidota bacterium]